MNVRQILLLFALFMLCSCTADSGPLKPEKKISIHLAGDSTCSNYKESSRPKTGWGEKLFLYMNTDYVTEVDNRAVSGTSTKSFISKGYWAGLLENIKQGDYVFIQFSHNDEKTSEPDRGTQPWGDFSDNLKTMISDVRSRDATPVLLTPLVRRYFLADGTVRDSHGEYPFAIKSVGTNEKVVVLDIEKLTKEWLQKLGKTESESRYMIGYNGTDNTHLQPLGAEEVAALVAQAMKDSSDPILSALVK